MSAFAQRLRELGVPLDMFDELLPCGGVAVEPLRESFHLGFIQFTAQVAINEFFPVVSFVHFAGLKLLSTHERTCLLIRNSDLRTASMVIPSNDAFVGNDDPTAIDLFDGNGLLIERSGGTAVVVNGSQVWDAGTEVNDELPENTAALAQAAPDTGTAEGSVVALHAGFQGSAALGGEAGNILQARPGADFTRTNVQVLRIKVTSLSGDDVLIDADTNEAPVLTDPGPQTLSTTRDTLDVILEATDANATDRLTFAATPRSGEFFLDTTLGLNFSGDLFLNHGGLEEKWLLGEDGTT